MENVPGEELRELGTAQAGEIHCVTIIGQIEGHVALPADTKTTRYEHIMPLLAAIEESEEIKGLLILLNDTDETVARTLVGDLKAFGFPTDAGRDVFVGEEFSFRDSRLVVTLPPRESRFILFEQDKKGISR